MRSERLLLMINNYHGLVPAKKVEQLKVDMQDPDFYRVMMATFGPSKYFLKPEALNKHLKSPKGAALRAERLADLEEAWEGWQVLAAMSQQDVSGDEAKNLMGSAYLALPVEGRQIIDMILDKTWRNGVTDTAINEAVPGTFRPAKFMLAHKIEERLAKGKVTWPLLGTIKYDGYRGIFCQDTQRALSRNGNEYPLQAELKEQLRKLGEQLMNLYGIDYVPAIDGELFKGNWSDTAKARKVGYDNFIVFGMLPSKMIWGGTSEEFNVVEFLDVVDDVISHEELGLLSTPIRRILANEQEMEDFFKWALEEGYEGLVMTSIMRPYESKRSYHWLKRKPADPVDAKIVDVILGAPRSKNEGKVVSLKFDYKGVVSAAGNMKQELIDKITDLHANGDLIGLTAEIVIHELTPDGAFRHGRVKQIRFDK